jgi:ADP-ribose pyrophosphatase YjhB (NUDIX family)
MKLIDKLAWIEIKDNAILLARSCGKDKFYIPGGKRELGETDEQALFREIHEELSVILDSNTLEFIGTFEAQAHGRAKGVIVKMTCYAAGYSGELRASSEIEALRWFTYAEKDQLVGVDRIIFDHLNQKGILV